MTTSPGAPPRDRDADTAVAPDRRPRRPALLASVVLLLSVLASGLVLVFGPSGAQTSESTGTALPAGAHSAEAERRLADSFAAPAPTTPCCSWPATATSCGSAPTASRMDRALRTTTPARSLALLGVLSLGALGASSGLPLDDSFRETPEAVAGQRTLASAPPAGAAQPLAVVSAPEAAEDVAVAAREVDGVVEVRPGSSDPEVAVTQVVLGAAWLVFDLGFGFPALDQGVPLLSFLFLVALGVDYSVLLIARTREDVLGGLRTRSAVVQALAATGGVITSAGIVLAAVFAVLGVLPIIVLTQIGVIVGIGVLLDTLIVRTVLVPSLAMVLGERYWWPSRPERTTPLPQA